MYHVQTSLFYNLQELIRNSPLLRKYFYLFQALDLSGLPDRNHGVGRTGHSQHAILRAFIVKHLQQIKSVPQLIEYIEAMPPLMELCGFTLGRLPDESQFYKQIETNRDSHLLFYNKENIRGHHLIPHKSGERLNTKISS